MSTNWSMLLHSVSAQLLWFSTGSTLWNWRVLSHMPWIDLLNQLLDFGPVKCPQTWIFGMKSTKFFDRPICPENVCACNDSSAYCRVNQFKVASADALAPAGSRLLADCFPYVVQTLRICCNAWQCIFEVAYLSCETGVIILPFG